MSETRAVMIEGLNYSNRRQ